MGRGVGLMRYGATFVNNVPNQVKRSSERFSTGINASNFM